MAESRSSINLSFIAGVSSVTIRTKQVGFSAILAVGALGATAHSADEHVSLSATTEFNGVHPGESGILAIEIDIEEDWHIYWPGVSDSGFGISFTLRATGPVTFDEPIWPTPKRYLQPGEILDHVYEETALVLIPFTLAEDAAIDDTVVFDIDSEFLVCSEICLPGQATASTSITILDESSENTPTGSAAKIHKAYEDRPKEFDPKAQDVRVQWISHAAAIMFRDATKIEFFPSKECTELAEPIVGGSTDSNRLVIKFSERTNKVLSGRIRSHERTGPVDYDINIKAP